MSHLPLELVLHVIDTLVDFGKQPAIALKANDWRATQLRQWLFVSRATGDVAARHLYAHCMYIDSHQKLMLLTRTLSPPKLSVDDVDIAAPTITHKHLSRITSLYLAPCGSNLDDLPAAVWMFELLCVLGPHLKRFMFDFPFESLSPHRDHLGVYQYLRNGLARLTSLEELAFLQDDFNLTWHWPLAEKNGGLWWAPCRGLRRVVLPYRNLPDNLGYPFIRGVKDGLPPLTHLVIHLQRRCMSFQDLVLDDLVSDFSQGPLKVIQVHQNMIPRLDSPITRQLAIRDNNRVELHSLVLNGWQPSDHDDPAFAVAQMLIKQKVLNGTLWDLHTIRRGYDERGNATLM